MFCLDCGGLLMKETGEKEYYCTSCKARFSQEEINKKYTYNISLSQEQFEFVKKVVVLFNGIAFDIANEMKEASPEVQKILLDAQKKTQEEFVYGKQ